jgi:AcrR family transcriptional regulator
VSVTYGVGEMSRPLSRERIIAAAVALADREGYESVTLRRVAAELGVHVTSLYNHVETRDALIDGIIQRLMSDAILPLEPVGWEEWVASVFHGICDLAIAHPGAFDALQHRPVQGEEASVTFEVGLEAFAKAGLGPGDAYSAVKATVLTTLAVGLERANGGRGEVVQTDVEALSPERFPQVRLVAEVADNDATYSFILEALVSGLRSQLRRRRDSRR